MPTYAFSTAKELTAEQRARLVKNVMSIHQVEARAPRYFVQVVFYNVEPGSMLIGGDVASPDHVWVRADIRSGRSRDQKANILQRVMKEASEILDISEQAVWVYVSDIPAHGVLEFGSILPEPAGEERWLASLPGPLRARLTRSS